VAILRGSVIWAILDDPSGKPILDDMGRPKSRPALVLSSNADIQSGKPLVVAAISTKFDPKKLPSHWIPIPSQPGGHPDTGLDQPCVVKSNWMVAGISQSSVTRVSRRRVHSGVLKRVLAYLARQGKKS
jgi:mRNA-degrading endonuclease toxin of MazEF toxin-antitoxin module